MNKGEQDIWNTSYRKEQFILSDFKRDNSYSFCDFDNVEIRKMTLEKKVFRYCVFEYCHFHEVIMDKCLFIGCTFKYCSFSKVDFKYCQMFYKEFNIGNFAVSYLNSNTSFVYCQMAAVNFENIDSQRLILEENHFIGLKFINCNLSDSIFLKNKFNNTIIKESILLNLSIIDSLILDLIILDSENENLDELNRNVYVNKNRIKFAQKDENYNRNKDNYERMIFYYHLLKYLEKNTLNQSMLSEYRYQYQYYSMLCEDIWGDKIWAFLSYIICGFGEKMNRFLVWFLLGIIFPAFIYMFNGIKIDGVLVTLTENIVSDFSNLVGYFGYCLHFSLITLSTVGYGISHLKVR